MVWATGDKGGYEAFAVGDYASKVALSNGGAAHGRYIGRRGRLSRWRGRIGTSGSRRDTRGGSCSIAERGKIEPKTPLAQPGPALAPIQTAGRHLVS